MSCNKWTLLLCKQIRLLLNQLCMTYLFTKRERSLISSALKKSCFLKSMLLLNVAFNVIYTGNKKIVKKIIFWWCLNMYHSMILSRCYYKSSYYLVSKKNSFLLIIFCALLTNAPCNGSIACLCIKRRMVLLLLYHRQLKQKTAKFWWTALKIDQLQSPSFDSLV